MRSALLFELFRQRAFFDLFCKKSGFVRPTAKRLKLRHYLLKNVHKGIFWRVENHSRTYPAHNLTNLGAFFWSVTMCRTILARRFLLTISTMVEATAGKIRQMLILFGQRILMQPMTAIQANHFADNLLFIFNSAHFSCCVFYFTKRHSYIKSILTSQSHKNCA